MPWLGFAGGGAGPLSSVPLAERIKKSPWFGRIVNGGGAFKRLMQILQRDAAFIVHGGGGCDEAANFIPPTLLDFKHDVQAFADSAAMSQEIFGPITPILRYKSLADAIKIIKAGEKPLTMYCFSSCANVQQQLLRETSSGSACINDCIIHLSNHNIPFGGVGLSGVGSYHGHFSFLTFSHSKAVMFKTPYMDLEARYPPYTQGKQSLIRNLSLVETVPLRYRRLAALLFRLALYALLALGFKKYLWPRILPRLMKAAMPLVMKMMQ